VVKEDGDGGWADFSGPTDPISSRTSEPDLTQIQPAKTTAPTFQPVNILAQAVQPAEQSVSIAADPFGDIFDTPVSNQMAIGLTATTQI